MDVASDEASPEPYASLDMGSLECCHVRYSQISLVRTGHETGHSHELLKGDATKSRWRLLLILHGIVPGLRFK